MFDQHATPRGHAMTDAGPPAVLVALCGDPAVALYLQQYGARCVLHTIAETELGDDVIMAAIMPRVGGSNAVISNLHLGIFMGLF